MIDNNGLLHFLCSSKIAPHKQQNYYTWKISQYKLYAIGKHYFNTSSLIILPANDI